MRQESQSSRLPLTLPVMLAFVWLLSAPAAHAEKQPIPVKEMHGKRVIFLGDSITAAGQYVSWVEYVLNKRFAEHVGDHGKRIDIISLGLGSETASCLSEKTHPFPRPCVHTRLDNVLKITKPDWVVACYGMNDGIYHPPGEERMKAYQDGIRKLIKKCHAVGAKVVIQTPPPFFPQTVRKKLRPAGDPDYSYRAPYENYNDVLAGYGKWVMSLDEKNVWTVDLHTPMMDYLHHRQKKDPNFTLARDGIHPGAEGHLLMARAFLRGLGIKNQHAFNEAAQLMKSDPMYKLVAQRRAMRSRAWMPYIGYTRGKTFKTDSVEDAEAKAKELQLKIDEMRKALATNQDTSGASQ